MSTQAPTPYIKNTSFTTLATQPILSSGLPGTQMDAELAAVSSSLNSTINRLGEIQRDDGLLRNGVVGLESLSVDAKNALAVCGAVVRGTWAASTNYEAGDVVVSAADKYSYLCAATHTSSADFDADFLSNVWAIMGYRPATSDLVVDSFTAGASQTAYTLSTNPVSENNTQVFVDGVYQSKSAYAVSGLILTLATAPATGAKVEVVTGVAAELINNIVTIPTNSVGTLGIVNQAVTASKIADGTITSQQVADGGISVAKLADGAVSTVKLADGAVTADKLAGGSVDSFKLATNAVQTVNVQDGSITSVKFTDGAVTTAKIADAQVTTAKIADAQVTTAKIVDDAITSEKIALGAIIPNLPSNFPIQIVGATKSDIQTIAGSVSTWVDVVGLSITLTRTVPIASGKIRIQAVIPSTVDTYTDHGIAYRIIRDSSTVVGVGNSDGNRLQATANTGYAGRYNNIPGLIDFIDSSPGSASTVSYKIQAKTYSGDSGFINRSDIDTNVGDYIFRTISTMTLTELT